MGAQNPRLKARDIYVRRGDTYRERITLRVRFGGPIDLTGYSFLGQIRTTTESAEVIASFVVTVLDAEEGIIEIVLSAATTSALPTATTTIGVYDIKYTTGAGDVRTFMRGSVYFESDVSRA